MVRSRSSRLLALCFMSLVLTTGCARDLKLTPPTLEIVSVSLVPVGAGSAHICRIAIEVNNPSQNSSWDADEIAMTIDLRGLSPTGLDYTIDSDEKTVPAGQTVEFSPTDAVNGFEAYSYTITVTRNGEQELTEPAPGDADEFVSPCSER